MQAKNVFIGDDKMKKNHRTVNVKIIGKLKYNKRECWCTLHLTLMTFYKSLIVKSPGGINPSPIPYYMTFKGRRQNSPMKAAEGR